MKQTMLDYISKDKFDDLYTPDSAIRALLKFLPPKELVIWECCDSGNSKISSVLRESLYSVVSTDIKTGLDFINDPCPFNTFDMIITNPPYSLKNKFLEKCYYYNKPFALLLPITSLEGVYRNNLFTKYGISVIVLDKRIDFTGKGSCWFNTSWFVWNIPTISNNSLIFDKIAY